MKELFGAVAMFYSVSAGAGGALTPPAALIGTYPQLNFAETANTGGYLMNTAAAGTILSDGGYYDAAAGGWVAKDAASVGLEMNGVLGGFILYANTGLTPGNSFSPSYVIDWLGAGSHLNFTPRVEALAGALITGGTNPTTGNGMMLYGGSTGQIIQKDWSTGTLGQINIAGNTVNLQVGPTAGITSTFTFGSAGQITHLHSAQAAAAETLYTATISDDATALFRLKNGSATNSVFIPNIVTVGSSTNFAFRQDITITTDSGTNPCWSINFDIGGSNVATRPLLKISSVGADLLQLIPLGTGNNAALSWGTTGVAAPAFTTRSAGTRLVLLSAIDASHVDAAIGSNGGSTWLSIQQATNSFRFQIYAGITNTCNFWGDGLLDNTGTVRATGQSNPSAGAGVELAYNSGGSDGYVYCYNRGGATWLRLRIQSLSTRIEPQGTLAAEFDITRTTFGLGMAYKTTVVTAAGPTTIASTDDWTVANPTVTAAATYNLPATPVAGEEHTVTDEKGIAAGNNITISGNGKNISGGTTATTEVIATNFGSRTLRYNGTNWNIIAKV